MKTQIEILTEVISKMTQTSSMLLSGAITAALAVSSIDLFGVSMGFIVIVCVFMSVDWGLGVSASVCADKQKFESKKVTYTILKFATFFMWLYFINQAKKEYADNSILSETVLIIQVFVLILIGLREFVSIGENIERIWGDKPYIFKLVDMVFESLERVFKKKIDNINKE